MVVLFLLLFHLVIVFPAQAAAVRKLSPECPYDGHPTCFDGIDNDGNGTVDEGEPLTLAFSAGSLGRYHANMHQCQLVDGFAQAPDPDSKATGQIAVSKVDPNFKRGEMACAGDFAAGTYKLGARVRLTSWFSAWINLGSTNGQITNNSKRMTFLPSGVFGWQRVQVAGIDATYALSGKNAFFIAAEALIVWDCLSLVPIASTAAFLCPGEEPGTINPPNYTMFKLSGAAPASCADAQFGGANVFNGAEAQTTLRQSVFISFSMTPQKFIYA